MTKKHRQPANNSRYFALLDRTEGIWKRFMEKSLDVILTDTLSNRNGDIEGNASNEEFRNIAFVVHGLQIYTVI